MLLIITLAAGLALGGTYTLTKDPIDQQALITAENARKAALPEAESFEKLSLPEDASVDWAYAGLKDGAPVGYVAQKTVTGFGGKVEVIAGVDIKNAPDTFTIGGITVGGSDFSETAGLGARAKEPAFAQQFTGKIYPVSYIKAGDEATESTIDAITSATITTTAVVNGVNDIVKYVKGDVMGIAGVEMPEKPASGVYSASAQGFRGPVYVEAAFDSSDAVTYIKVGDESFAEDIGVGAVEPEFMIQFIGKKAPVDISDVDVLSGATITTKAVISALNDAHTLASGGEIAAPAEIVMPEKPAEGVFSASAQGFRGPVYVEAAFDDSDAVTYIKVGDESFAEDIGVGAVEPEFMIQFIGKKAPVDIADVDVLSGATITTQAVVSALNDAHTLASGGEIAAPAEIVMPDKSADGVFSAAEQGFAGPVYVEASFDGDGKITYISVGDDSFAETEDFGARALQEENQQAFIGAQMPLSLEDVDVLSGATFTKTAIVNGLNKAYQASLGGEKAAAPAAYTQEINAGNAILRLTVAFENGQVASLSAQEKAAGASSFGDSASEKALQDRFLNAAVPVSVNEDDAILFSAAVAINQAYTAYLEENPDAAAHSAAESSAASAPAFRDVRHTVEISTLSSSLQVKVSFVQDTVAGLVVLEKGALSDAEYTLSEQDGQMKDLFLASTLPLRPQDQETPLAAAVASAINAAYYSQGGSMGLAPAPKTQTVPDALIVTAPAEEAGWYTSEVICFFTVVRVNAAFENGAVSALSVADKPVGTEDFLPSEQEAAMKQRFIGASLPLDVPNDDPYAACVAVAINQAYLRAGEASQESAPADSLLGHGSSLMFFTNYGAVASFEDGRLKEFTILTVPANGEETSVEADKLENAALYDALIGQEMPLDPGAYSVAGLPEYAVTAIVIALNQAFENTVAALPL